MRHDHFRRKLDKISLFQFPNNDGETGSSRRVASVPDAAPMRISSKYGVAHRHDRAKFRSDVVRNCISFDKQQDWYKKSHCPSRKALTSYYV